MFGSKKTQTATREFGQVGNPDAPFETLVCACGNTPANDGMATVWGDGVIACICADQRHAKDESSSLAIMPDAANRHTMCLSCGRIYNDIVLRFAAGADVINQVDLDDPQRRINMRDSAAE